MSNMVDVSQAMCESHDAQNRYTRLGAAESDLFIRRVILAIWQFTGINIYNVMMKNENALQLQTWVICPPEGNFPTSITTSWSEQSQAEGKRVDKQNKCTW